MQTLEERALATDIRGKLIELYVDRQEAREAKDLGRTRTLQAEIDELRHGLSGVSRANSYRSPTSRYSPLLPQPARSRLRRTALKG
jgi:hypothetical protein